MAIVREVNDETTVDARPILAARHISKRFGEVQAVDDATLELQRGEVHAVLGENGAGKTTLMNILSGLVRADSGEIALDDEPVAIRSPRHAASLGIGMVHQHFRLVDRMTVAENLHLGWSETPRVIRPRELGTRARELLERFGGPVDPDAYIADLSVAEQQVVAIVRTLSRGTRILILDEPTAVLTAQEATRLFDLVRAVVSSGTAVVFISHKLREVVELADRVTVMRRGRVVAAAPVGDADERELARLMIGHELRRAPPRARASEGSAALVLSGVSARNDRGLVCLSQVTLTARRGEIVGLAGVAGNGQRELAEVATGLRSVEQGSVTVGSADLTNAGPRAFVAAGVGYVAEDRNGVGLVPSEAIWRNAVLRSYRTRAFTRLRVGFSRAAAKAEAASLCAKIELSTRDVGHVTGQLSGGNAQRLLVGREVALARCALVAAHPTRGLDIAAADTVKRALLEAREQGLATLLISEDLDELIEVSDRIVVIYEGRIVGEFPADSVDEEELGLLMGRGTSEHEVEPQPVALPHGDDR
jgi:ABC-type uncharacterized transport system ATPase subunit